MGTASYVLVGTEQAMKETFGSTCHGAGRAMSRKAAIRKSHGRDVKEKLEAKGKVIRSMGTKILAEEAPYAYKDVHIVVDSVHGADISRKVANQVPLGVVKG
jgi:tRNA-splicing ligase RtcB